MNVVILVLLVLFTTSCSGGAGKGAAENAPSYQQAVDFQNRQVQENNPVIAKYFQERIEYENSISLYESKKCYLLPGGGVTLLMRINRKGVIDLVLSEQENSKTQCYRDTYLGTKFKEPEIFPLYAKVRMDYKNSETK